MKESDPWQDIPDEKKLKILNASIKEFSEKGYYQASTNEIIKNAEISKGLLFHYFGSKKRLYLSTLDLIIRKFIEEYFANLIDDSNDIFEKLLIWTKHKLKLLANHPLEYKLLMDAKLNTPNELAVEFEVKYKELSNQTIEKFFLDIDYTRFRTDIDPKKAIELIMVSLDGLSNKYAKLYKENKINLIDEMDTVIKELEEYLHMLKVGLYP